MKTMAAVLTLVALAGSARAPGATITFQGTATDLQGNPLPPAAFVSLKAVVVDDGDNRYEFRDIRRSVAGRNIGYRFIWNTDLVASLENKGIRITLVGAGRMAAVVERALGTTADGNDAVVTINLTLPNEGAYADLASFKLGAFVTPYTYYEPSSRTNVTGLYVTGVEKGSPAHKQGFERGDIIVAVNGYDVPNPLTYARAFNASGGSARFTLRNVRTGYYEDTPWITLKYVTPQ